MAKVIIDKEKCKSCRLCVSKCPVKILKINNDYLNDKGLNPVSVTDEEKCIGCLRCATICPDCVITIEK